MSIEPFVSIICPTFNDPHGIKKTINSLLTQSYPKERYEIIVVDNNSTDNTSNIVNKFNNVKYLLEDKIQSSYASRNLGIKNATGEILAFIDSECIASKNWINSAVKIFQNHKISGIAGEIKFTYLSETPNCYEYIDSIKKMNQKEYVKMGFGATANIFFRKEIFKKYGLFNENLISGGDYEFGQRITSNSEKLIFSEKTFVFHPARTTISALLKKTIRVAKGQKQLKKEKVLKHGNITLKKLLPTMNIEKNNYYYKFSIIKIIKLLIVVNIVKYRNILERLK